MNYDDLLKKVGQLEATKNSIDKQRGGRHRDIDKCGFGFRFADAENKLRRSNHHDWPEAVIVFGAYSGYYGSSSCSNDMDEFMAQYIIKALNVIQTPIIDAALNIIDAEIQLVAQQAAEEAAKIKAFADGKTKQSN